MGRKPEKIGARQAAKGPPDRALLRYAPPSPKRGLGPSGNDPSRKPDTAIAHTIPQPIASQRRPIGHRRRHCRLSGYIIGVKPSHHCNVEQRRETRITLGRIIPSLPLASPIRITHRRTYTTWPQLPQNTIQSVPKHSAGHEAEPTSSPHPGPNHHPSPDQQAPTGLYRWGRSPACRSPATSTYGYFPLPCGHSSRGKIAAGSGPSLRYGRYAVQSFGGPVLLRPIEADRRPVATGD